MVDTYVIPLAKQIAYVFNCISILTLIKGIIQNHYYINTVCWASEKEETVRQCAVKKDL